MINGVVLRIGKVLNEIRIARIRLASVHAGPGCRVGSGVRFTRGFRAATPGAIFLGTGTEVQNGAVLDAWGGQIRLGNNVFVGPHAVIYGHGGVEIGDNTLISMHCCILSSNHSVPPRGTLIRSQPDELLPTRIGADVWIGAGAIVLGGVRVGDGCVIGAGAVVSHDIPDGSIAMGVPARIVRQR